MNTHTHTKTCAACGWPVGTKCNCYRVSTCRIGFVPNIPPQKSQKTRPLAQALITSANGKPDSRPLQWGLPETAVEEMGFLGILTSNSCEFPRFDWLSWAIDFEALKPSFKLQKFHFWKVKLKCQRKFQKTPWLTAETQEVVGLKAKHQKQKNIICCNSFKWPNYSCWCLV